MACVARVALHIATATATVRNMFELLALGCDAKEGRDVRGLPSARAADPQKRRFPEICMRRSTGIVGESTGEWYG